MQGSVKRAFFALRGSHADTFRKNHWAQSLIRLSSGKPILLLGVVVGVQVAEFAPAASWTGRFQMIVKMQECPGVALRGLALVRVQKRRFYKRY